MTDEQTIIAFIEKYHIEELYCEFDCGGDSMGDTVFTATDKEGEEVDIEEIENILYDFMYKNVEFYENSGGQYIGEAGKVHFNIAEDEEEKCLECSKDSRSEWSEQEEFTFTISFSEEELNYLNTNIEMIGRERWGSNDDIAIDYSRDFLATPIEEKIEYSILKKTKSALDQAYQNMEFDGDVNEDEVPHFEMTPPFISPLEVTATISVTVYKDDE
jgi:hypothetical protein